MLLDKQMSSRRLHIEIEDSGLYVYNDLSATGKTYLIEIVQGIDSIFTVTYNKVESVLSACIEEALSGKYALVLFDRCDLYMTKDLYCRLEEAASSMTVVLDLKGYEQYCSVVPRPAQVVLEKEVIYLI